MTDNSAEMANDNSAASGLRRFRASLISFGVIILLVAIDQISKLLVLSNFKEVGDTLPIIGNVLHFTYIRNDGAVFGSMSGKAYIFNTVTVAVVIAGIVIIAMGKLKQKWLLSAATLIISGGIGNLIDRFRLKYVVDFIDVRCFGNLWTWVFNFADCCVVIGCIMLIIWFCIDSVNDAKKIKAAKAEAVQIQDKAPNEPSDGNDDDANA